VIRKVLEAGTAELPPKGLGHSPQSRAIYGFDFMLRWQATGETGKYSTDRLYGRHRADTDVK